MVQSLPRSAARKCRSRAARERYSDLDAASEDDRASDEELQISFLIHFVRPPVPNRRERRLAAFSLFEAARIGRSAVLGANSGPAENMALVAFRRTKARPSTESNR